MSPLNPFRRRRQPLDPFEGIDDASFFVFVPAIMSVGLVFSVITLIRDAFRWTGTRARERRTVIEARTVVNELLGEPEHEPSRSGLLSRSAYVFAGLCFIGIALYVAIGSTANFLRPDGYVHDIGWLLAVGWGLSTLFAYLGVVSISVARTWPNPPAWASRPLRTAPLSINPNRVGQGPPLSLTIAIVATALATMIVTLMVVTGRALAKSLDEPFVAWLSEETWLENLGVFDPFGSTLVAVAFVALIGVSGFRCRVMAVVYPTAFVASWMTVEVLQHTTDRPRPSGYDGLESFPSGHMVQVVFITGLLPLALGVLLGSRKITWISRALLVVAAVATGVHRIYLAKHWPLDSLGGLGIGAVVVLTAHWALEHRGWHQRCASCPWSQDPGIVEWKRGVISLRPTVARRFGRAGVITAVVGAAALGVATLTVGLPADPEGSGLGSAVSQPVQLTLAALLAIAGVLAIRWKAVAAFLIAVVAVGLGLFASIEYTPLLAVALTAALLLPAVLIWFSWQPSATLGSIAALALLTASALTGTGLGTREVHEHYFGPAHPESVASGVISNADWLWLGGVAHDRALITAGGLEAGSVATLTSWPADGSGANSTVTDTVDSAGVARFELAGLTPDTEYSYRIGDGDETATGGEDARFSTFDRGAQDLHIALGSCARRGSNGRVFETIAERNPDLYLALGDLHYGNLVSQDPHAHINELGRAVGQPAQSLLFSSVPTAYVWDDHDYGPNDADASSPARQAVSEAYRIAVPAYNVAPDPAAPIAQAFTVGRVRVILTDTRSRRDATTMLGEKQLDWFLEELATTSPTHAVVIWANPTPWIGAASSGGDAWSSYPEERRRIADTIAGAEIHNLVMVSGDAHMVAIDDGTNTDYATDEGGGFPLLHAAALDRPGSVKGGPYSHGTYPGAGQFAELQVADDGGDVVVVTMAGYRWDNTLLVEHRLTIEVPATAD